MIPRKKEQLLNGFFGCSISSCGPIENSICCIVWSLDTEGLSCPKKVAHINFNWHINVIVCLGFIILFGFSYLFFCFSSFRCFRSAFCTACDSKWIQFFSGIFLPCWITINDDWLYRDEWIYMSMRFRRRTQKGTLFWHRRERSRRMAVSVPDSSFERKIENNDR